MKIIPIFWGLAVPNEGYSNLLALTVPNEDYSNLLTLSVPDEDYSNLLTLSVPDKDYSRNASRALNLISTFSTKLNKNR